MPDANEAKKLWNQIMQLERTKPGKGEDARSFFQSKSKEMSKLRQAYDKATGLQSSQAVNEAIKQKNINRMILGQKHDGPETSDTL